LRRIGNVASKASALLIVFEGFYDLALIGNCSARCGLDPCTDN
jgi:hypothetical protein